ncbi:F-box/FBD/LRR-repeat protein At1g13570-like [Bidens hawaiensis]|uniref:F-box/FBD/LRR-repeat protein At1g13570-like n=1 Tax=Bidens hawaiensis TaxID=980011 RepID=UPI00404ADC1D
MEYENPTGSAKKTQCLDSDIISSLPQNIIECILSRMPIRDAVRTSVLSKKWQYCWQSMPKLEFTGDMVELPPNSDYTPIVRYKLASVIFHVLLSHNGPEVLDFDCPVTRLDFESEVAKMMSYLAKGNKLKELYFENVGVDVRLYKLPVFFFSLQRPEVIHLQNCIFEPPLAFNGFSRLTTMVFWDIEVSPQTLQRFLSKCPMLENIHLWDLENVFIAGVNKITFADVLQCVPLIKTLHVSKDYVKYLSASGMPRTLPTSLVHLKDLELCVCLMDRNEMCSVICIIRSSPVLEKIVFWMYDNEKLPDQHTPNFLDPKDHPDLNLNHLVILEIRMMSNYSPIVMEFAKLVMAKSSVLKKVQIHFHCTDPVNREELKMLLLSFPRASPSAKLIIGRPPRL